MDLRAFQDGAAGEGNGSRAAAYVRNRKRSTLMRTMKGTFLVIAAALLATGAARADKYSETVDLFTNAGQSASFFGKSHGYAVFPTIGKAGIGIGGAHGEGRVYEQGKYVGDTKMTQLSVGFQLGGQAFSQIIFFQDKRAFDEFTSGNFEFGANASAVVITAAASGTASTTGASGTASGGKKDAATAGEYHKGTAVFIITKGGLMYEASVSGQKFSYTPLAAK
jgi:lipid-binding SYLF domain-containing protein